MPTEQQIELRAKLVAALRSGEYKQGMGKLASILPMEDGGTEIRYCCLGVACVVAGIESWVINDRYLNFSGDSNYLPQKAREAYGFKDYQGKFGIADEFDDGPVGLADMNDSGESFEKIADIIEQAPEGLFED